MKKTPKAVKPKDSFRWKMETVGMDTTVNSKNWREHRDFCVKNQTPLKKKGKVR